MALQLTKELPSGFSGNYWKIVNMRPDFYNDKMEIYIALFKDETAKTAGKRYIDVRHYTFKTSDYSDFLGTLDIRAVAYGKIKTMRKDYLNSSLSEPEASELVWEGALDV